MGAEAEKMGRMGWWVQWMGTRGGGGRGRPINGQKSAVRPIGQNFPKIGPTVCMCERTCCRDSARSRSKSAPVRRSSSTCGGFGAEG